MVGCSIPEDHCLLTPVPILLGELVDQASDKQDYHYRVGVRLTQGKIAFSVVVKGKDETDSGCPELLS